VHHLARPHHLATEGLADALMARHTPRIGSLPAKRLIAGTEMPASFGVHGPGEITMRSGASFSISASDLVIAEDMHVRTNSPRYWTSCR